MTLGPRCVLVHGAWEGGWAFSRTALALRGLGAVVHTPTLTGCGDRAHIATGGVRLETHIQDVVSFLHHEDLRDVVLVGHSYGGTVITGVAARVPERLRQLVYLDASAPVEGQNATGAAATNGGVVLEGTPGTAGAMAAPLPLAALGVTDPTPFKVCSLASVNPPRRWSHRGVSWWRREACS